MHSGIFATVTIFAGLSNSICGVGTGNIAIPYLSQYFPVKRATGTSVVSTVVACVLGTLAYIYYGWDAATLDVSLCLRMVSVYVLTAVVGAYIVHFLPARIIEIILGIVLIFVATKTVLIKKRITILKKKCTPGSSLQSLFLPV